MVELNLADSASGSWCFRRSDTDGQNWTMVQVIYGFLTTCLMRENTKQHAVGFNAFIGYQNCSPIYVVGCCLISFCSCSAVNWEIQNQLTGMNKLKIQFDYIRIFTQIGTKCPSIGGQYFHRAGKEDRRPFLLCLNLMWTYSPQDTFMVD